ncbi:structural protein [Flavobacterium phage FLiP]|uniref:Structural protein n=1 Tax=Flavobacterium phage FLiP TaxID=2023716 RepID=A0A222NPA3_9VIRU|nr:virion structural protein [Flavobacterium phage FLiP]ASQ41220.1 structural protein [Flavobacterium phage FLiP]
MGFLKKVFKRKEGGTFLGNIIRGVASNYTGGILGSGAQMKKGPSVQEQIDQALANSQAGASQQQVVSSPAPSPLDPLSAKLNDFLSKSTKDVTIQGGLDKNTKWYIGGALGAVLLVVLLTRKK